MSTPAISTPLLASPKQLRQLFNVGSTTLWRLEHGRHAHSQNWPKPKVFGGRKLYDVAQVTAFFAALPPGGRTSRGRSAAA